MKKAVVCLAVATALFSTASHAAWYTVTINNVGANDTTINLNVTDTGGAFSNLWIRATGTTAKEILATGLTGMALEKKLLIRLDTITENSSILGAYLKP